MDEAWASLARLTLQDWERDLNSIPDNSETGGRLKFYRILKASPSVEQCIEAEISLNKRRVITQLRTGCLPLEVELGRYRSPKTPLADRLCQLCKRGVGDEPYLLLDCSVLSEHTAQLQHMMTRKVEAFIELSRLEKVRRILSLCGSDHDVGKLVYHLVITRANLLK